MSILPFFNSEPPSAKFAVQILSSFHEPAAIFAKNGDLKFANPEWRISLKDGNFANIFDNSANKDVIFRLQKAIRRKANIVEKTREFTIQVSPLGDDCLVRCMPLNTPQKKEINEEKPKELVPASIPMAQIPIDSINEVPRISSANLLHLIAGAPLGLARLSKRDIMEAQIIGTNPAFERISGLKSGDNIKNLLQDADISQLEKLRIGNQAPIDLAMKANPQTICESWLLEDGEKGAALLLIDISDRREMEGRLNQANKMEVIGKIAADVAHELNNILSIILLNTDVLLMRHTVGDPSYQELQNVRNTSLRGASLVHTLLAFSRKQTIRREVLDIGEILSDFEVLLNQVLDERIKLDIRHGRDLPAVLADKQQLETIFMNLITNARDAVLTHNPNGGNVWVKTETATREDIIDALKDSRVTDIPDVKYCRISVKDNGTGMSEETAKKIFEPFFTTKDSGKGTGIGMASVYGIVKQSGGYIGIESAIGEGTAFSVFLPTTTETKETPIITPAQALNEPPKRAKNLSGKGKILLVEDEDRLREITALLLRQRGFEITEAGDGEEALEILTENPNSFDLLISDVVMPIMDGPTMLKAAKPFLVDTQIIFMSGYAEQDFGKVLEQDMNISFLPKPFELTQLAEKVKSVLAG
jgi:two-component system, cell cycle sensor histidine kinase and response regulator CckA